MLMVENYLKLLEVAKSQASVGFHVVTGCYQRWIFKDYVKQLYWNTFITSSKKLDAFLSLGNSNNEHIEECIDNIALNIYSKNQTNLRQSQKSGGWCFQRSN